MPDPPPLRRSLLVALFVTVAWGAATFGAAGIIAVVLDRDPVESEAVPFAGLVGLALAAIAVWLSVGFGTRGRTPWLAAVTAAASVYLIITALALLATFDLFVEQATSPFVLTAAVLAGAAVVATWALSSPPRDSRPPGSRPPQTRPPDAGLPRG